MDSKRKFAAGIVAVLVVGMVLSASVVAEPANVNAGSPNTAQAGDQVTVDFSITNTGDNDSAYALDHSIPSDWTVVSTSDDGGTYSEGKSEWVFQTIQPGETRSPSVTFQIPNDAQTGDYTIEGVGKDQNGTVDTASTTITVTQGTPTPTPEPDTPTPTFEDDDDDEPAPDTPTPTDTDDEPEPDTPTPTDEPDTPTDEPDTPTPTDEPDTPTPTEEPDTPSETPEEDDGISTFLILLIVLILIAVVAGVAYYALGAQE